MLFGDNMFVGNTAVNAVYLGDTQVWSAIPADVKAHIARVTADGGTVPEQAKMVAMVKKLITANLWNNCVFFGLPLGGVKKDGNQFVSKVYDLKANADLSQATGTRQPKYDNGNLIYDGGDFLLSPTLSSGGIYSISNKITVFMWVYITTISSTATFLIGRHNSTYAGSVWTIATGNSAPTLIISNGSNANAKAHIFNNVTLNQWCSLAFTFNGSKTDLGVQGLCGLYTNATESRTLVANSALSNIPTTTVPLGTCGQSQNLYPAPPGYKTGTPLIFNDELAPAQITWLHNNIRPEGV